MSKQKGLVAMLKGFAGKVLDRNEQPFVNDQLTALEDLLARKQEEETAADLKELARVLKRKHVLDSISISQMNGSLLASSNGNGVSEAITASALFNYVQSEIPKSEVVLIKSKNWNMLFRYGGKIFVIKAPTSLSTIEMRAISKEVEAFLNKANSEANAENKEAFE
jgi:hypothetical protein